MGRISMGRISMLRFGMVAINVEIVILERQMGRDSKSAEQEKGGHQRWTHGSTVHVPPVVACLKLPVKKKHPFAKVLPRARCGTES